MIDIKIFANTFFIKHFKKSVNLPRCLFVTLNIMTLSIMTLSIMTLSITGCGQKGDLYLVDASSQTVTNSSEVLDSGSTPQDVAFSGIDDEYQKQRSLEQQRMLDDINNDSNDY